MCTCLWLAALSQASIHIRQISCSHVTTYIHDTFTCLCCTWQQVRVATLLQMSMHCYIYIRNLRTITGICNNYYYVKVSIGLDQQFACAYVT